MKAFLSKKLFEIAENRRFAIPAFNIFNLESARSVVSVAEKFTSIIILQISESTLMKYFDMEILLPSIKEMISKSNVPIVLHLDHARDLKIIKKAVKKGFTSVMFDGSLLPLDENIKFTKRVVRIVKKRNKKITVEGEVGIIGKEKAKRYEYTNPEDAEEFTKKTNVDLLAVSIGNVHGLYQGKPKLNFKILKEIKDRVDVPLVLHGASGLPKSQIRKAIDLGIRKVNFFTELKLSFLNGLKKGVKKFDDPRKVLRLAEEEMKKMVIKKIKLVKIPKNLYYP